MLSLPGIYFFPGKLFVTLRQLWCPHLVFLFISSFYEDKMLKCEISLATGCGLTLRNIEWPYLCAAIHSWNFYCAFFLPAVFSSVYLKKLVGSYAAGCHDFQT